MASSIIAIHEPRSFAFGPFVFTPERQLLKNDTTALRVGSRALELLTVLVERPGELITKRELMERIWPDTIVEEGNLKVTMAALRRALGDEATAARYIATVIGRGYRFIAPVIRSGAAPTSGMSVSTDIGADLIDKAGLALALAQVWTGGAKGHGRPAILPRRRDAATSPNVDGFGSGERGRSLELLLLLDSDPVIQVAARIVERLLAGTGGLYAGEVR